MTAKKRQIVLARPGYAPLLQEEFASRWNLSGQCLNAAAVAFAESVELPSLDTSVFARQYLPQALPLQSPDRDAAVDFILSRIQVMVKRANRQSGKWTLHVFALDDDPCIARTIQLEKAVLAQVKSKLAPVYQRFRSATDFIKEPRVKDDVVIQVYLPSLDELWLSIATLAMGVSPHVGGNKRMRVRAGSPSRSCSKLEEAFFSLGRTPKVGETAVDLGAAPGGWSFVLASYGADVTAVDHGDLKMPAGVKLPGKVAHLKDNGLKYQPDGPVDWLCCDMLLGSRESLRILSQWLEDDRMRHFVVNIKLPQANPWPAIAEALGLLQALSWPVTKAKHLYHDRQEITLMGTKDAMGPKSPDCGA